MCNSLERQVYLSVLGNIQGDSTYFQPCRANISEDRDNTGVLWTSLSIKTNNQHKQRLCRTKVVATKKQTLLMKIQLETMMKYIVLCHSDVSERVSLTVLCTVLR